MIPFLYNWGCNIARGHHRLPIPEERVRAFVKASRAESWQALGILYRPSRPHVCVSCDWLCELLPRDAHIFEPACGSGANLLWLYTQGFSSVSGTDIAPSAVSLATLLAQYMDIPLQISIDDALNPKHIPQNIDALLSINWLYHIHNVSLEHFFDAYSTHITRNGYIIFDMICDSYSQMHNQQWHTQDLRKKLLRRRLSEYRLRMSREAVATCAARCGYTVVRCERMYTVPKRWVYAVRKN